MKTTNDKSTTWNRVGMCLLVFACLNFSSSFFINMLDQNIVQKQLPVQGGLIGPLTVDKDRAVYEIVVSQSISINQWSLISGEVLDHNKNYLFGFGKELWKESGHDTDGTWVASQTNYEAKIKLQKGTYFLNFESEHAKGINAVITVEINRKAGSILPFIIAGIAAMLAGLGLILWANRIGVNKLLEA